jgi:hypothetical protein
MSRKPPGRSHENCNCGRRDSDERSGCFGANRWLGG